jgi:hypothetical protein
MAGSQAPVGISTVPMIRMGNRSIFDNEGDLQLDPVFRDLTLIVYLDLLILHPCGLKVRERFMGARDAQPDGIIKALWRRRNDFRYFSDCHGKLLLLDLKWASG